MTQRSLIRIVGILVASTIVPAWLALGCPFCTSVSQTLSEEFAAVDAVVIARLEQLPQPATDSAPSANQAPPTASFAVTHVLKGKDVVGQQKTLSTVLLGDGQLGDEYLVMGIGAPELSWSTPLKLGARQRQYLLDLTQLPPAKTERLAFFQQYLEDADEMLRQDAYDEFALAPYATVKELKPKLNHDQLIAWIQDANVPPSRKRLYFTLLGVCGDSRDVQMLEQRLRDTDQRAKSGLDALIACYLTLHGPAGMPLVEELFLTRREEKPSDQFPDMFAAIMALRFHGTEGESVPRQRILQALHLILDYPEMADLVIPDLARWEDWSQLDRLVAMFKAADGKETTGIRLQIVNYVRKCPVPAAKQALEELNRIDPAVVKRSMTFFPPPSKDTPSKDTQ